MLRTVYLVLLCSMSEPCSPVLTFDDQVSCKMRADENNANFSSIYSTPEGRQIAAAQGNPFWACRSLVVEGKYG